MTADLTIYTASLPERVGFRRECMDSVAAQTVHPERHVVSVNYRGLGQAEHKRHLIGEGPYTNWIMVLDDDDLLDPTFIETTMKMATELGHPAVVWPYCRGGYEAYNQRYREENLLADSVVAHCAVFSAELWEIDRQDFRDEWGFDWRYWQRLAEDPKVTFQSIPEVLWTYRHHDANESVKDPVRR